MLAEERQQRPLQFDFFELDSSNYQLRRRGMPVELPPQAMRILVLLAARPDELVTRKEIKEALWPGQSFGDFDSRVNFTVKKLREALGDDAERPRYVQTVRNAGYRFIAPVRAVQISASPTPVADLESFETASSTLKDSAADNNAPRRSSVHATSESGHWFRLGQGFRFAVVSLFLMGLGIGSVLILRQRGASAAGFKPTGLHLIRSGEDEPKISSVTPITAAARQRIVIRGRGFGMHVPYARTDSPYLAIRNETADWAAGRMVPHNWDEVMVDVESWTDTEIVITGFSGDYGKGSWKLRPGDNLTIAVWNPQNGIGPALYHTRVIDPAQAR